MQKVGSAAHVLDLAIVVDQDAEPADLDQAVAEFLLKVVSKRRSAGAPDGGLSIFTTGDEEGYHHHATVRG